MRNVNTNSVYQYIGVSCLSAILALGGSLSARAASFYTENFAAGTGGWQDRDPGEMTVSHSAGFGNPAGSLQGSFASQGAASPEIDAFRADGTGSSAAFVGDYWTDVPNFSSWSFDFYSDDILPSDVLVRFSDGINTFFRSVSVASSLNAWQSVSVSLSYAGWFGGSASAFSNALAGVTFVDVQVSRSGTGAQSYFLDNFALNGGGGGGGGGAVPEPEQGLLILGAMVLFAFRRQRLGLAN